ncbi:glutathione S-transferase family protein [Rhodobacterales bacterium HKCCE3408]|nr:glutathione S-transferase family protein [Rhodobacterales bacterium HKCCE3408]
MGKLVDGQWITDSVTGSSKDGKFHRPDTTFRDWITADGSAGPSGEGGFEAESGRYHLYVAYACPWANRTLVFRALKGLEEHIDVSVAHPDMLENGWSFDTDFPGATGDPLLGANYMRDIYLAADPNVSARATVPILWDKKRETIVSNESAEIIRMFNSAFDAITGNRLDFYPEPLRDRIDEINARVYDTVNNGVYKAGFARSQKAYEDAATAVFESLDWLEGILADNRYLTGAQVTEADWRLFTTLARFDLVYNTHFKCNRARLIDYPNLWAYTRELYQWPGVADTVHFNHITRHYYYSHESINPHRIIPIGPEIDWWAPHGREALRAA